MKITQSPPAPPPFKSVTIVLETREEVEKLHKVLGGVWTCCHLYKALQQVLDNVHVRNYKTID